jgi:alpha-mannosidase
MVGKLGGMALVDRKHLEHSMSVAKLEFKQEGDLFKVENRSYRIVINKDGSIHSWKDKRTKNFERELCRPGDRLNKLSIHQDVPFFWDAWDVMLHSFETVTELKAHTASIIEVTESRVKILFEYNLHSGKSTIKQTVAFHSDTARVDFITEVDWHEEKKLLKAYFPVDIRTDYATFDVQSGTIRRATHANTSWDAAKHEMYGHKFCDLSEARFGVALLNDAKYGYSVRDGNMGLSLLKASKFPDHEADMKVHNFVYSLLPHDRPLEESTVFDEAHRLNTPLWVVVLNKPSDGDEDYAMNRDAVNALQPIQIDQANINVMALKQSEDSDSVYILRINEDRGEQVTTKI